MKGHGTQHVPMAIFEKYIQLLPGRLGFGCAPKGRELDELTQTRGVNVIVNIRQPHPKVNVLWYKDKLDGKSTQVLHIPLELPPSADQRKDVVEPTRLVEQARKVSSIILDDETRHVFIHGFNAYNYTSVFALLVWTFAQPQRKSFNPLHELKQLYGADMVADFPASDLHRRQLMDIIKESSKDLFTAFARVSKKRKTDGVGNAQNGPGDGPGDGAGSGPSVAGDFGNDASVAGGAGAGTDKGVQGFE